jgi:hypothetical protein
LSIFYSSRFYDRDFNRTSRSAAATVPALIDCLTNCGAAPPASVIDIGCGRGVWLKAFGKIRVKGRDGPWTRQDRLLIDPVDFTATDLSQPFAEPEKFDLAMTLEVAEHIEPAQADQFVTNLTGLSDTILFSASIVGQGGQHHVNEQPLSYWAARFAERGYALYDVLRPRLWYNAEVCWWYRQNMVVLCNADSRFRSGLEAAAAQSPALFDLAHPDGFSEKARLANLFSPEEYVGLWLAKLGKKLGGKG